MNIRTPLDVATAILEGFPRDLPQELVDHHCEHKDALHKAIRDILWAPMPRAFKPGVLEAVQAFGGQFAQACQTTVPGGETFASQKNRVIKFWVKWPFETEERKRLTVAPSIGSQVIYLPNVVGGSLRCTYDKVDDRDCVQEILDRLPKVAGLRWILGNAPTYNRVLANHLKANPGQYLLPDVYTRTTDTYEYPGGSLPRLVVGVFRDDGVRVDYCRPGLGYDYIGLLPLGVPA